MILSLGQHFLEYLWPWGATIKFHEHTDGRFNGPAWEGIRAPTIKIASRPLRFPADKSCFYSFKFNARIQQIINIPWSADFQLVARRREYFWKRQTSDRMMTPFEILEVGRGLEYSRWIPGDPLGIVKSHSRQTTNSQCYRLSFLDCI
jgi:hypothetical protein